MATPYELSQRGWFLKPASPGPIHGQTHNNGGRGSRGHPLAFLLERVDAADLLVVSLVLAFGLTQFLFVAWAPDFRRDDVFYMDAARSLLQHHFYGIEGRPETNMPPGLSAIIAGMCMLGACGHAAILRMMAALQTLGFVASYFLLRRLAPRAVAAVICVVLSTAPVYFWMATEVVQSHYPYFLLTTCALLVVHRMERDDNRARSLAWGVLLAVLAAASLMMASAAIALVGALLVRVALRDRRLATSRARLFLAAALVGLAVQLAWSHRQAAPFEWPIPGYPRPYLQQLLVKSGNDPELGLATPMDVVLRVARNTVDYSGFLTGLVTHHWIDSNWASVGVVPTVLLLIVGWLASVRRNGGEVYDWYFAAYAAVYLLWPWTLEARFVLPVAPLACLYLWRGGCAGTSMARKRPRVLALALLPFTLVLAALSWAWVHQGVAAGVAQGGVQARLSLVAWSVGAALLAITAWRGRPFGGVAEAVGHWRKASRSAGRARRALHSRTGIVATAAVLMPMVIGMGSERDVVRANLDPRSDVNALGPDAEAGLWLSSHADPRAIVMARHVPTVFHFSGMHVVWFAPSSNARLLVDGIRRLRVDYMVVAHRQYNYYLPSDDDSFAALFKRYPAAFRLAFQNTHVRIYAVDRSKADEAHAAARVLPDSGGPDSGARHRRDASPGRGRAQLTGSPGRRQTRREPAPTG